MNLPPTYRHDYGYQPPSPAPVYDTPRIVERRPMLASLRLAVRRLRPAAANVCEADQRARPARSSADDSAGLHRQRMKNA
jgi:hypothetical protein